METLGAHACRVDIVRLHTVSMAERMVHVLDYLGTTSCTNVKRQRQRHRKSTMLSPLILQQGYAVPFGCNDFGANRSSHVKRDLTQKTHKTDNAPAAEPKDYAHLPEAR